MKEPMPNSIGNIAMIIVYIAYKFIFTSPQKKQFVFNKSEEAAAPTE